MTREDALTAAPAPPAAALPPVPPVPPVPPLPPAAPATPTPGPASPSASASPVPTTPPPAQALAPAPPAPEPAPAPPAPEPAPAPPARAPAPAAQAADSVLDACEPIFSTLLDLRPGGPAPDTHTLYGSLAGHLATFRGRAGAAGLTDPEADAVTFALAAFADETVMRSEWGGRGQWPLLEYATFGTHYAGEEFYRILGPGQASPNGHDPAAWAAAWPGAGGAAVVEVYALCLLFGFRGRHAVSAPDEYQRELARVLARVRSRPAPPLSPRPLSRPFGEGAGATGDGRPWVLAGSLLLLGFLAVVVVVAAVAGA